MSESFTKLCSGIIASTVWGEPHSTRSVWTTMLALADQNGYVGGSVPGLARLANATLAETEAALATFLSPDPFSRSPDHEGRRIKPVPGGWVLLNHAYYRALRAADDRREQNRAASSRYRQRQQASASVSKRQTNQPRSAQAEAEAEAEAGKAKSLNSQNQSRGARKRGTRLAEDWIPSESDLAAAARLLGTSNRVSLIEEAAAFRDYWLAESGQRASKLNWSLAFMTWCRKSGKRHALRPNPEQPSKVGRLLQQQGELLRRPR